MKIIKYLMRNNQKDAKVTENTPDIYNDLHHTQVEFFNLIKSSPLSKRIKIYSRDKFKIDFKERDQSLLIRQTTALLEAVISFWDKNKERVQKCLRTLPGRYIHVDQGQLVKAMPKYRPFFDGLLVSEQILMTATETKLGNVPRMMSGPLRMSLLSAACYLANEDLFMPKSGMPHAFLTPATRCLDPQSEKHWLNASQLTSIHYLSELFNRQFDSFELACEYALRTKASENDVNPDLLQHILKYRGATNLRDFEKRFREAMIKEQGITLKEEIPPLLLALPDVHARISEFERFSSDAYSWGQISAVPYPEDLDLYKWWVVNSSRIGANTLGVPYDEDSLFIFAAESQALGFLQKVGIEEVLKVSNTTSAQRLRSDLRLSGELLRKMQQGSRKIEFDTIGGEILKAIDRFETESHQEMAGAKRKYVFSLAGLSFSLGLMILSQAVPPLSIISLVCGSTLADVIKAAKVRKQIFEDIKNRPISALCDWKKAKK